MTSNTTQMTKTKAATIIAVFFHAIGLLGILFTNQKAFFVQSTPFNLLLCLALIIWTQSQKNLAFYIFFCIAFVTGIVVEVIGVNTSMLFGEYQYGAILGPRIRQVPWVIGINWFIVIYCCGISIHTLLSKALQQMGKQVARLRAISVIVDGATLAVFFDWVMEPAAVQLGFWQWNGASIPLFNYISWLVISMLLLSFFHFANFNKQNKFAIHLLLIQLMFFLLLRTFL